MIETYTGAIRDIVTGALNSVTTSERVCDNCAAPVRSSEITKVRGREYCASCARRAKKHGNNSKSD